MTDINSILPTAGGKVKNAQITDWLMPETKPRALSQWFKAYFFTEWDEYTSLLLSQAANWSLCFAKRETPLFWFRLCLIEEYGFIGDGVFLIILWLNRGETKKIM